MLVIDVHGRRAAFRWSLALLGLLPMLMSCGDATEPASVAAELPISVTEPPAIVGNWDLREVNGKPSTSGYTEFALRILDNGSWSFIGNVGGSPRPTKLRGGGTWKLVGDTLEWTKYAGTQGSTKATVTDGFLDLADDPVVLDAFGSATRYERVLPK